MVVKTWETVKITNIKASVPYFSYSCLDPSCCPRERQWKTVFVGLVWGVVGGVKVITSSYWAGHKDGPWGRSERTANSFCTVRSMRALNWQISSLLFVIFTDVKFSPGNIIFKRPFTERDTCTEYRTFCLLAWAAWVQVRLPVSCFHN